MQINPITCNSSHRQNFKSNITFDIGGSQREGSCKIYYSTTETDEEIFKQQTTVNKLGKTKFKDGDDFIRCLVKKMGVIQKACRGVIREKEYPRSENTIKNIAFFLPSYTCGAHAYYLPNHRAADNRPLKDIDFDNLVDKLKAAKVNISPDVRIKIVQDAMGAGMAICQKLYDNDMLRPGSYYTVCITGGGCGISNIEMYDEDNVIIKSSGSGYLSQSLSMQKVSKAGASAPAL